MLRVVNRVFAIFVVAALFGACSDIPLPPLPLTPDGGPTDPRLQDNDGDKYTPAEGDCDDANFAINPGVEEIPYNGVDDDCNPKTPDDDLDGDHFNKIGGGDCDDTQKDIHPGAQEIPYDGIDQDCVEGDLTDVDKDGFDAVEAGGTDCDDHNPYVNPTGTEICGDGIDQDCKDGDQPCSNVDGDGDGYSPAQGDCNDKDPKINPGAQEIPYNGKDDDCKSSTPDDDLDGDHFTKLTGGDCNDNDKTIHPSATEIPYDGIDQDCTGGDLVDVDKDGFTSDQVPGGNDCNDKDPKVHPGAQEIPYDSTDQDCDGSDLVTAGAFTIFSTSDSFYPSYFGLAASGSHILVAWKVYNSVLKVYHIYAQRYSVAGTKQGSLLSVASLPSTAGSLYDPTAASDGTNFLVVWRERSVVAPASKIHARQISGSGTLGTVQTPFSTTSSIYDYPTVTFGGAGYAIAWKEAVNGYTIRFLRLTAAGAAIFVPLAVANDASSSAFQYAHLEAQTGSAYLLTWNGQGTSGYDIFGRAISKTGSLVGNPLTISSAPQSQYRSRSSFNGTDFLVTWYDYRSGSSNCEIYGQRVTTTGALVGTSAAGNVAVSLGVNSQRYPDPVWCGGRYSVFFQDYRYNNNPTLFRQKISGSGKLIDADAHANEIVYANSNRVDYPIRAVCAGQKIFVVWREGNTLHGTLVAP